MEKPNIVFIQSDSMDGRVMGCLGHPAAYTPNFDKLAARGTLFANAYCNSPQCCPSRASMWSGKYTHEVEGWNNYKGLADEDRTFRMDLVDHGYEFVTFGKLDYLSGNHSLGNRVNAWTRSSQIREQAKKGGGPKPVVTSGGPRDDHKKDWSKVKECCDWLKGRADIADLHSLLVGSAKQGGGGPVATRIPDHTLAMKGTDAEQRLNEKAMNIDR